jgi:O-antigen/teichoic acid export membrane protein
MGGAGIILNAAMQGQQLDPKNRNQEFQKKIEAMNEDMKIPNIIFIALNFIIAPMLVTGSIGCLVRKPWAYQILRIGLLSAMVFVAIRSVFGMVSQWRMKDVIGEGMRDAMKDAPNPEMLGSLMGGFFWVMVVMTFVWILVLLAFYLWCYLYLSKPIPRQYLRVE